MSILYVWWLRELNALHTAHIGLQNQQYMSKLRKIFIILPQDNTCTATLTTHIEKHDANTDIASLRYIK